MDRAHGTHANQLIWEGPLTIEADKDCELNSFIAMDGWLTRVQQDRGRRTLPQRIVRDKPATLTDECWDGAGHKLSNRLCPAGVVNVEGTPRTVAGDAIATDANKCQLKPLTQAPFSGVTFTSAQWTTLQHTFAKGVCDFSRPGVAQQPTVPWLTYQNGRGRVIYGGRPLGRAPASGEFRS